VKKIRLNAEKDVLTTTYKDALQALATLPHEKILSSLLTRIQQELPEAATIYTNARDEAFVRSQTQITYDGTIDTLGGIIVENKEKTLQIDYRYETIADIVWDRSLKEIAETLFK
jgi:vacuolar-type H+-ATPase subunit E/Vma4